MIMYAKLSVPWCIFWFCPLLDPEMLPKKQIYFPHSSYLNINYSSLSKIMGFSFLFYCFLLKIPNVQLIKIQEVLVLAVNLTFTIHISGGECFFFQSPQHCSITTALFYESTPSLFQYMSYTNMHICCASVQQVSYKKKSWSWNSKFLI